MDNQSLVPHVIIFAFKARGLVNSMLKLAELLCLENLHVTFLVSQNTQNRLLNYSDTESRFNNYPLFKFVAYPDEVYEENPCIDDTLMTLFDSLKEIANPFLEELLVKHKREGSIRPPVTCIIADAIMGFAIDVAEEMGVPIIYSRTISTCAFWAYFSIPQLIEADEISFKDSWSFATRTKDMRSNSDPNSQQRTSSRWFFDRSYLIFRGPNQEVDYSIMAKLSIGIHNENSPNSIINLSFKIRVREIKGNYNNKEKEHMHNGAIHTEALLTCLFLLKEENSSTMVVITDGFFSQIWSRHFHTLKVSDEWKTFIEE